jgi:hypothetical protein
MDSYEVVTAEIEFICVCGDLITIVGEDGSSWGDGKADDAVDDLLGNGIQSCSCGNKYSLEKDSEGDVVIKFKK